MSSISEKRFLRLILCVARWEGFWWWGAGIGILTTGILLSWVYWEDLRGDQESLSTTIRNLAFVIGGIIAIVLAVWRSVVAERQANTAQRSLLNERYQKGAEMLGNDVLSVRLGGVYALQCLAEEDSKQYHIQVMCLFCAFVINPQKESVEGVETSEGNRVVPCRQDILSVMKAIATRDNTRIKIERDAGYRLDFRNANLSNLDLFLVDGVNLSKATLTDANLSGIKLRPGTDISSIKEGYSVNLSKARLKGVNFRRSNLWKADFSNSLLVDADLQIADLRHADFSNATLANADLSGAELRDANLSGTMFSSDDHPPARRLTQAQLDSARADPNEP